MTPRVVYWNNIPAPYMVERFNALAIRNRLDFEAWFSGRIDPGRSWTISEKDWNFRFRYLPSISRDEYPLALPAPLLGRRAPEVLVTLYAAPSFLAGAALARRRGARVAFWVEATSDNVISRRPWKEMLKRVAFSGVDAFLVPGPDGRAFASRYGAPNDRTMIVPHVIDYDRYSRQSRMFASDRGRHRESLGIRGVTFIYVGRLLAQKGLKYLLDAYAILSRRCTEPTTLLLVGDGPEEEAIRQRCRRERLEGVKLTGFHEADALVRLYAAADVFVFPTMGDTYGLVVSEAMACGLPVITTSAVGEIADRVSDGVNGFVVSPANSAELLDRMLILVEDAGLRATMGEASIRRVAGQSPDVWADALERAVEHVMLLPRRHYASTGGTASRQQGDER